MPEPTPVRPAGEEAGVTLLLDDPGGPRRARVPVRELVIAGWTGRDPAAVEAHIHELEALGVRRPDRIPTFYPVSSGRLTTAGAIDVVGRDSTGEVEFVLIEHEGQIWVGVGSDHTDRRLETVSVAESKEACPKPLAPEAWRLADLEPHWDRLVLRAFAGTGAADPVLYQEGSVAGIRPPRDLLALYGRDRGTRFGPAVVMFCGTFPVIGGLRWADRFTVELEDPVRRRRITHRYTIRDAAPPGQAPS